MATDTTQTPKLEVADRLVAKARSYPTLPQQVVIRATWEEFWPTVAHGVVNGIYVTFSYWLHIRKGDFAELTYQVTVSNVNWQEVSHRTP